MDKIALKKISLISTLYLKVNSRSITGWTQNVLLPSSQVEPTIFPVSTQNVLLPSCHRVIKHYSTSIVTQDGLAIFHFYTVTGWANNVLCPSCHRVDPQCSTSPPTTGWASNVLLPSYHRLTSNVLLLFCHRVGKQCFTSLLSQY